jgi:hypothetical protein
MHFFQDPPRLGNQYLEDLALQGYLKTYFPQTLLSQIEPDLISFGDKVVTQTLPWAHQAEKNPPSLVNDAWGKRKQFIKTCAEWTLLHDFSATEG